MCSEPIEKPTSHDRDYATLDLRCGEYSLVTGNDNVAIEHHLRAATVCATIHGCYHWLGRGLPTRDGAEPIHMQLSILGLALGRLLGVSTLIPSVQATSVHTKPQAQRTLRK
jgi:hypothetical protein